MDYRDQIEKYEEICRPDHNHEKNSQYMTYGHDFYSDTGFIDDKESLLDVCLSDDRAVTELLGENGHELIGKTLICIIYHSKIDMIKEKYPELYIDVNIDNYDVKRGSRYCGSQKCPFVNRRTSMCVPSRAISNFADMNYTITNKTTGKVLKVNDLIIHLIYYHHFYQGNVPHRRSPEELITFFKNEF
jgi:hypothetical protein